MSEALVWVDVMVGVLGVVTEIDSHPVDHAVERAGVSGVIRADGGVSLAADVGGLVGREDEAMGLIDAAAADFLTDGGGLHPHLAATCRNRFTGLDINDFDAHDDDAWVLYDGNTDWTQAKDLSKQSRQLHELQRLWLIEVVKYNVLPLDDSGRSNGPTRRRPGAPR
jgi:hypothetical protein